MKKIFFYVALISLLYSCSKQDSNTNSVVPAYLGAYTSSLNDTVRVSQNGSYTKFVYRSYESIHTPVPAPTTPNPIGTQEEQIIRTFDSVRVASDLTFTNNEISETYIYFTGTIFPLPSPYSYTETAIGTGTLGTNTIQFHVTLNGGSFNFNGVKL